MSSLLEVSGLCKIYDIGKNRVEVLSGIDMKLEAATTTALVGASGAGKSTLLHLLGALDRPSAGTVMFCGNDIFAKNDGELASFRNRSIGFVFQFHHLLSEFTALENVMMPALIARIPRSQARTMAEELLTDVGLTHRLSHRPGELSGGEQQRVAIARALVNNPAVILADEPTGNLDSSTSEEIMGLFTALNRQGITIIMVTHEHDVAGYANRQITFKDGQIITDNRE
jgi:lipoprotein-releasing system ATP-binding protein